MPQPGRVSRKAFEDTLKKITRGGFVNQAYRSLKNEGLGNLRYKQSLTKNELKKAYRTLGESGVTKRTGLRSEGFLSRVRQRQSEIDQAAQPISTKAEIAQKKEIRRQQNELVERIVSRRTDDIGDFRKAFHKKNQDNPETEKTQKSSRKTTFVPTSGSALGAQLERKKRAHRLESRETDLPSLENLSDNRTKPTKNTVKKVDNSENKEEPTDLMID